MTRLLINIDHVATLRNARGERFPDPVQAAVLCETALADGIVFHLREDRRHIRDDDARRLLDNVQGKVDLEHSLEPEIVDICCALQPDLATLVPERREELTTEGGLDVLGHTARLKRVIPQLHDAGVDEVALFVDPIADHIRAAADLGANAIELHTGEYANAATLGEAQRQLTRLANASRLAHELGMGVHAGHGLDYHNFPAFRAQMPFLDEVSIGFAIIARALWVGLPAAVGEMRDIVKGSK